MTIRWNLPITVERCISSTKEVCNNADSPDIDGLSMASLAEYSEAQVRNSVLGMRSIKDGDHCYVLWSHI